MAVDLPSIRLPIHVGVCNTHWSAELIYCQCPACAHDGLGDVGIDDPHGSDASNYYRVLQIILH